jgi:hypothetical protein
MDREKLIDSKAGEIQATLSVWAQEQQILKPGEAIVFSMTIEKMGTVQRRRQRPNTLITAREVYDSAIQVHNKTGRWSMKGVRDHLMASPGLMNDFNYRHNPLRKAFDAAKAGELFVEAWNTESRR